MKFIFGVLLAMVASAFAINLQISSVTKQDSDGFVTFSFQPPAKSGDRTLEVEILLPGKVVEYKLKTCYRLDNPTSSFYAGSKTTRPGFTTLFFSQVDTFPAGEYTYVCPFHAPNVVDYRQIGIYLRFDGQDYFASNSGGTIPNSPFANIVHAEIATKYSDESTKFTLRQVPNISTPWTIRFGAPTDAAITTVIPVVFESINPSPACDVAIGSGSQQVNMILSATNENGAIHINMPPMTRTSNMHTDYVITCTDFIFNYPVNRSSVIEASRFGTGIATYSFAMNP